MTQTVPFRFHIEFSPHGSDGGLRYRARVLPEVSEVRRFELVQCSASQGPCHDPRSLTHSMPNQFSMPIHSLMHACIFAQTACSTYPLCMGMHSKSRISRFLLLAGSHVLPSPCPHTHPVPCRLSQYYLSPIPPSHTIIRTRSHIGPANPDPSVTCSALRLGSFASNLNLNASPHLTLYACRFKVSRAKEVIASVLKQVRALLAGWALGKDGPFGRMGP